MAPPALELRAIGKSFGGVHALTDVSLSVDEGTIVAVMGENGAGKSTLAGIVSGVLRPDSGQVMLGGHPVAFHRPADADRHGIRLVPQELSLCPYLDVAENVCTGTLPLNRFGLLDRTALHHIATARLASLGAANLNTRQLVARLSVVDQQFVQIARALVPGTRVLVVDEPTGPMSSAEVDQFMTMLRRIADSGVAVIFISHRLDEVVRICDRAVVLRDGRKVVELAGASMTRQELVSAMTGDQPARRVTSPVPSRADEPALTATGLAGPRLAGVTLQAYAGEVVVIYGAAGSGRETIGGALVGATPLSGGTVLVRGRKVRGRSVRASVRAGVGYVPAERRAQGLVLGASVRHNLTLATLPDIASWGLVSARRERAFCRPWLSRLKVAAPSSDVPIVTLSGGNQQKVLLARWLAANSQILVLEEPTRGVDIATKAEIWHLLSQLAEGGAAVIMVTSDVEEAAAVGNRVLVMRHGQVSAEFIRPAERDLVAAAIGVTPSEAA
jgi:ABC-type sugar transport system ATPase subunit